MLSTPIGLLQHGADGLDNRIRISWTATSAFGFVRFANAPKVFPITSMTVNAGSELRNPSINLRIFRRAGVEIDRIEPERSATGSNPQFSSQVVPTGPMNSTNGCGFPYVVSEIHSAETTDTVKPDSTCVVNGARLSRSDENPDRFLRHRWGQSRRIDSGEWVRRPVPAAPMEKLPKRCYHTRCSGRRQRVRAPRATDRQLDAFATARGEQDPCLFVRHERRDRSRREVFELWRTGHGGCGQQSTAPRCAGHHAVRGLSRSGSAARDDIGRSRQRPARRLAFAGSACSLILITAEGPRDHPVVAVAEEEIPRGTPTGATCEHHGLCRARIDRRGGK